MHDLVNYVDHKYKQLTKDFDFTAITSENLSVEDFYRVYAEKIELKDNTLGWHPVMLRHVVHLDVVQIFATHALSNPTFDLEDHGKLQKCLKRCSSDSKINRPLHPFSRLMRAIKSKYYNIDDSVLS